MGKAYYLEGKKKYAEDIFNELYQKATAEEKNEAALWITAVYNSLRDAQKGHKWEEKLGEDIPIKERLRSYFHFWLGNTEKAIDAAREAIAGNKEDLIAHLVLASALLKGVGSGPGPGRVRTLDELFRVSKRAVALDPQNASARRLLAAAEAQRNSYIRRQVMRILRNSRPLSWVVPLLLGLGANSTFAQWEKTFGGAKTDFANSVQQTADGGYILAGWTGSFGAGGSDAYLIKLDEEGELDPAWGDAWPDNPKTFGGGGWDEAHSVQQTADGGYIFAGFTESFGAGNWDVYLIKGG